jgi:hypothetical protein
MKPPPELNAGVGDLQAVKRDSPGGVAVLFEEKQKEDSLLSQATPGGVVLWPLWAVLNALGRFLALLSLTFGIAILSAGLLFRSLVLGSYRRFCSLFQKRENAARETDHPSP